MAVVRYTSERALKAVLGAQAAALLEAARPVLRPPPHVKVSRGGASVDPLIEAFFQDLQRVASAHGWLDFSTYNGHGPHTGLHCILVRECVVWIEVCTPVPAKHPRQQEWLDALRQAGQEVWEWGPMDRAAMRERLGRPVETR